MQNSPLRNPVGVFDAAPQPGAMYVKADGTFMVYTSGAWRGVSAGTATRFAAAKTFGVSGGGMSGSVSTDWSGDVTVPTTWNDWMGHARENVTPSVAMCTLATTDYNTTIGQNVWDWVRFNTVWANDNNMWDGGGSIRLNTSGFYLITAMVRFEADTDAGRRLCDLRVNGGYRRQYGFGATNSGQWGRSATVITHSNGSVTTDLWVYAENPGKNMRIYRAMLGAFKISKWNGDGDTP